MEAKVRSKKNVVLLRILNISGGTRENEITENEGVRSPMSKTRSKQGIKDKWRDFSNVSNTIVKQGIEGSFVCFANGPI